jgi:hypothetical protein
VGLVASLVAGSLLFFVAFGSIFNGSWIVLIASLIGYFFAGWAIGVSRLSARRWLAIALVFPALPFASMFFLASIPEAGIVRAALWPLGIALASGLALGGQWLGEMIGSQRKQQ